MKLNFGCGKDIKEGFINVDKLENADIDKSFNFNEFPYPFKNDTFEYVFCNHVLQYLDNPKRVLEELWRICRHGARIKVIVHHPKSDLAYGGEITKHRFGTTSFDFFKPYEKRNYYTKARFWIKHKRIALGKNGLIPCKSFLSRFLWNIYSFIEFDFRVIKGDWDGKKA